MVYRYTNKDTTESGFEIDIVLTENLSCEGCPLKTACTNALGNREIRVSMRYLKYKKKVREKLSSDKGYALAVQRMIETESVFGQLKNNRDSGVSCFAARQK